MFPLPKGKPEFSKLEEAILQKWKAEKTFEKSVESRPADNPYRFYDGPPFITGTPHYGSLLSSIIKDVVPRYQTMLGKRVERVWGWDCHGLPIEQKVQKKLGLESNKEIEESAGGIQGFIDECYAYTRDTSAEWSWYIDHIGRWVDMDNAYRTMDQNYMESVMWVFKQIWEKGYIYEGKRVSWYSWKLSTPISNFEIAMDDSYQDVQDPAITVKFPIKEIIPGVAVVIQDEAGKVLMIKNKKDGLWRFGGGHVEKGEDRHTAAARELLEETGITCALTPYCTVYEEYRGNIFEAQVFRGTVPVGQKVVLEEENFTEYEYFSLDALPIRSEIHSMEYVLIDFLTGVREPILLPEDIARPVSFLAWTTTPWTMPMHMALAVNKDITYAQVLCNNEVFILAQSRVETVFKGKGDYQIIGTMRGEELVGLHYNPPFSYYLSKNPFVKGEQNNEGRNGDFEPENPQSSQGSDSSFTKGAYPGTFKVYHADFVTDTDGTGIAHEAPEFGDVDFQLAKQEGIFITSAIDEAGKYTSEIPDYQGQLYLDCIDPITERLKAEGKLFKKEGITHRVPYCPRSNTPLMQKAQKSWFIDIQRIKSELIAQNENINWFPDHFKHGRFLKSLESAPDWCISRSRFWGTPMPVWQNADGSERVVIDSREELYERNKPLGQITKLVILRHAQSEANVAKCYDDIGSSPLSEKGRQQAQDLVQKLQKEGVEVIISSPFVRTIQTITPFSEASGISIETMIELKETEHGKFANQPQNGDDWRECLEKFRAQDDYRFGETGETKNDLYARAQKVIDHILAKYPGKTVAIVSHGFPTGCLEKQIGAKRRAGRVENAEPRVVYLDNNTGKEINLHRPTIDNLYIPNPKFPSLDSGIYISSTEEIYPDFQIGNLKKYAFSDFKIEEISGSHDLLVLNMQTSDLRGLNFENCTFKRCVIFVKESISGTNTGINSIRSDEKIILVIDQNGKIVEVGSYIIDHRQVVNLRGEHYVRLGRPLRRIPEVLDVWMDSASMPYAQVHYPFENQEKMEASFPADFIAEYTGQIRAWFYVMHAIGVMVKCSPAFKNVAVTGVINGTDGRKMSKSYGNYPDPRETIQKYGADAIRFYLMGGTLMKGEDMAFSEAGIQEAIKRVLLPLWNAYTFFATYANIDGWMPEVNSKRGTVNGQENSKQKNSKQENTVHSLQSTVYSTPKTHELDTWIISRLHTLIQDVRNAMDAYDLQKTCDVIMSFLDGLNNWYIRRNRRRFWRSELDADKKSAYETLHEVLVTVCQLLAPICPFITEHLYQNLTGSVIDPSSFILRSGGKTEGTTTENGSGEGVHCEAGTNEDPGIQVNKLSQSEIINASGLDSRLRGNDGNSIHLTDFPVVNEKLINLDVNQKMADLQALTNLGLAIRGREKLRVRQPLRAATITLELDESARETLAEELNVKEIHTVKDVSEYVTITYSPDAKKIGATERKQWMKTIIADAKAGKGNLTSEGTLELAVSEAPGGKVVLSADEFEAVYTPKEGSTIAFAGSAGYVIGLDTTLDEELTIEGYSRDLIRAIQDARKELGFQVTDRLQLALTSDNEMLGKILAVQQGMIEKETLTTLDSTSRLRSSDLAGMTGAREVEIDEEFLVNLTLTK